MKPYIPQKLPLDSLQWDKFITLIGEASSELGRYDGTLQAMINPLVLLSPLTIQEAVLSSKIEGTETTLEQVMEHRALPKVKDAKTEDILEVINYQQALLYAEDSLKTKPISLNLIKEIHYRLLASVRGRDKARGEFRKIQNFVGKHGAPIEQASYVPPPPEVLMEYLDNFEKYIHYEERDRLVQLAIVHAQFEIIHPFLDGNGRVGRILIPLFLVEKNLLSTPTFYISAYLEANRDTYYERLNGISKNNDWESWISFFLTGVIEQARANGETAKAILALYDMMKREIANVIKSQYSIQVLDALFELPIFSTTEFIQRSSIPKASAMRILNTLRREGIIEVMREGKGNRPAVMLFSKLLSIVE
ncbi:MAG: cell filamentation protein Fic [Chloroflexi bacterium RBG_13_46_9]|nr:MAG: cell filamentation protein Fic [Chloroflexi bacterium RBG_13_46_9]